MLEKQVRRKVRERLRKEFGEDLWLYSTTNAGYGTSGAPDFLGCLAGIFFGVECKRDKAHKPTALQKHAMETIRRARGSAFVVYDEETLDELVGVLRMRLDAMAYVTRRLREGGGDAG